MTQQFTKSPDIKAEDSPSASGDLLSAIATTRQDTLSTTSSTDGDYQPVKSTANGRVYTSATVDAALPAGNNNVGDVDVASIAAGDTVIGRVKLTDGSLLASVRDTGSSDSLNVAIVDASGNQITTFGGTAYTEDAVSAADPVGAALIMVRADSLAAVTTTDGDNIAARATNKGEQYVKHVDSIPVTDNGGNLSIDDGGNSITVDYATTGSGTATGALRVELPTNGTGVLATVGAVTAITNVVHVDDNAGSLTVDNPILSIVGGGTEAVAQRVTIANNSTGVLAVTDNSGSLTVDNGGTFATQVTAMPTASTATITAVNCASSATIFAANAARKGAWITNDGAGILYVKMGTTATSTDYTVKIAGGGFYELPGVPYLYTGRIDGIFDGTGAAGDRARATELT